MFAKGKRLLSTLHPLNLLSFLLTLHHVVSNSCEQTHAGTILNCWGLSDFPNGEYYNVSILNLHNNHLNELKTSIFDNNKFYNLKTAVVRHSNISYIYPNTFSKMWNILELDLYGNNLTIFQENTFNGLESLQHLDLGHNEILAIDASTLKPLKSLITLDLTFNRMTTLPPHLIKHRNISQLELSGNPIHFPKIGEILESHSLLRLSLQSCNLKGLPSNAFNKLPQLIFLDLSKNNLYSLQKELLKPLFHLEVFDLSYNSIQHLGVEAFSVPSKLDALLCNETPLELTRKCEEVLESLRNESRNFVEDVVVDGHANKEITFIKLENGEKPTNTSQQSKPIEEKIFGETFLLIFLLIIIGCLSLIVVVLVFCISWQKRKYEPLPTRV